MRPIETIHQFDQYLKERALFFEAVVIGGAALSILGIISRETQDVDVLDPEIPSEILTASRDFAKAHGIRETTLRENWLNAGPESLRRYLRLGWRLRLMPLYEGANISLQTLGRIDLVGTKLLAYCDRGQDLQDCIDLKPSREEILDILPWVETYDGNPGWPVYVRSQIGDLARRLGYGL